MMKWWDELTPDPVPTATDEPTPSPPDITDGPTNEQTTSSPTSSPSMTPTPESIPDLTPRPTSAPTPSPVGTAKANDEDGDEENVDKDDECSQLNDSKGFFLENGGDCDWVERDASKHCSKKTIGGFHVAAAPTRDTELTAHAGSGRTFSSCDTKMPFIIEARFALFPFFLATGADSFLLTRS